MKIERADRTWQVFVCACPHITICEGEPGTHSLGALCRKCEIPWTKVAHIPRVKPYITIHK